MSKIVSYKTRNGQEIDPLCGCNKDFKTRKTEGQRSYRLVQILPPVPQRFEWVNEDNIVEVREGERRLARAA